MISIELAVTVPDYALPLPFSRNESYIVFFIHFNRMFYITKIDIIITIEIRGVFHLRVSVWLENCTIFPQFTLPGTNSEVKCSS